MEPMPQTMKIARRMVKEIEALNNLMFGPQSWSIIEKYLAQIDERYLKAIERLERAAELEGGYTAFLRSCALSGEQPETFEWYLAKHAESHPAPNAPGEG